MGATQVTEEVDEAAEALHEAAEEVMVAAAEADVAREAACAAAAAAYVELDRGKATEATVAAAVEVAGLAGEVAAVAEHRAALVAAEAASQPANVAEGDGMPPVNSYVLVGSDSPGLCFKVEANVGYGVVFDDGTWQLLASEAPWRPCPDERHIEVAGVVCSNRAATGLAYPEAYLYKGQSVAGWTVYEEYRHPPAAVNKDTLTAPRLPELIKGQLVDCFGKVWGGAGEFVARSSESLTFVGIAEQHVAPPKSGKGAKGKKPQLRRFALVGLPDSNLLTWAELVTKDAGLIRLAESDAEAIPESELQKLEAAVPLLLGARSVGDVNNLFARMKGLDGAPSLRPRDALRKQAPTPSATDVSADISVSAECAEPPPPSLMT